MRLTGRSDPLFKPGAASAQHPCLHQAAQRPVQRGLASALTPTHLTDCTHPSTHPSTHPPAPSSPAPARCCCRTRGTAPAVRLAPAHPLHHASHHAPTPTAAAVPARSAWLRWAGRQGGEGGELSAACCGSAGRPAKHPALAAVAASLGVAACAQRTASQTEPNAVAQQLTGQVHLRLPQPPLGCLCLGVPKVACEGEESLQPGTGKAHRRCSTC